MESLLSSDSKELQEKIKSLQHENNCLYADLDRRENEIIKLRPAGGKIAFPLNSFAKYFMQVCLFRHSQWFFIWERPMKLLKSVIATNIFQKLEMQVWLQN